ncbi:acyl-homoserine-lactone synthase [Primorskyibacter sp. S87]|uniref:acyl-homoserine-lactone synthase n=1 Tax=Primorskyibacter sp. S87 TaxID=3415126 RepID=UPI003C7EC2DE
MIIVIDSLNKHLFGDVLDQMFELRARVFQGRLGWDVKVSNNKEIDEFDALDPVHVVSLDDDGDVVGCMRLLQTTGPHMLADVFAAILDGEPPLRSAQVWEATRFCVDTVKLCGGKTRNSISYVTSEVMIGAFEYAKRAGVLDAVAVIDPVMNRVLQRSGNAPNDYLGSAKQMGKVKAMAALMDCSDNRIDGIRNFAGIRHDVFLTEQEALERFALRDQKPLMRITSEPVTQAPAGALQEYMMEQMRDAANDPAEAEATERLVRAMSDRLTPEQCRQIMRLAHPELFEEK